MNRLISLRWSSILKGPWGAALLALLPVTAFAAGNAPQPNICTRACWGARAATSAHPQMSALTRAIVHHTAGNEYNTTSFADSQADMRAIQNYHMNTNGWSDIGYHFLVDKFGNIFEGRAGSMTSLPRGAHDATNTNSFGFTCLGYFHPNVNNVPSSAMMNSLYDVIAWRMPGAWRPYGSPGVYGELGNSVGYVDGHRRVKATACPGDNIFNPYMGTNMNAGPIRDQINARIVGVQTINPPFTFSSNTQGWTPGNGVGSMGYENVSWPGVIYVDQLGSDAFIYSPPTNFTGSANQLVHVRVYPQNGSSANHEMQLHWKTAASNAWDSAKSSTNVTYVAQNGWMDVYMGLNGNWTNQTITQLRLDFDNTNTGTRWIVDTVEVVNIVQPNYTFDSNGQGFSSGNSMTPVTWTNCCGWPGIIYGDQNGNDAFIYSPLMYRTGGSGDWIKVRVFPQSGTTANHQMQIFWTTNSEPYFSSTRSSSVVNFTAQDQWTDVYLQVGNHALWNGKTVLQLRVDFDQTNSATRWLVDSVEISGPPPTPPAAPSGLSASAVSNSQINLSWADNSNDETNFVVARSTTSGGPYADIATLGANVTSYSNTGLAAGTTYHYVVRAANGGGASATSSQASATTLNNPPAAPGGLSASGVSVSQINLSWTDNSNDETNFVVARSTTSGGPYTDIATLGANVTSYSNTGLAANTTYYYVVRATSGAGASANSAQASGVTWPNEIIADNANGSFTASANWSSGTSAADKYGADYRFRPTAAVSDAAVWTVSIPQSRNYELYAWWAQGTNRSTTAPYILPDNTTVNMNQQGGGGAWNSLGIRSLTAGTNTVKLSCWTTTGFVVVADAVRVVPR